MPRICEQRKILRGQATAVTVTQCRWGGIHRCLPTFLDKEMEINYFLKALHRHSYFYFTSLSFSLVVQSTPMLLLAVQDIGISHNLSNSWPYKGRGGEEVLMDRLRDLRVCLNI